MKFDDLKGLDKGTMLIDAQGDEVEFVCIHRDELLIGYCLRIQQWTESEIKNWTIKKEPKLYWRRVIDKRENSISITVDYYSDDHEFHGKQNKIGNPVDQDGNEVTNYGN